MNQYAKRCIVTGGAGFIGSALVRLLINETQAEVLVVDKLTYAGVPESLKEVGLDSETLSSSNPRLRFLKADICDQSEMDRVFDEFKPDTIFHLAAESHVDRSIDGPGEFIRTNVVGTATLLQAALKYWKNLGEEARAVFRFQHISTDEVYGSLDETGYFTEKTPYSPHSPYSASKASSDHLVRAWHDTYGLPVLITNCSNNYGPYHFPEKLIPLIILKQPTTRSFKHPQNNFPAIGNTTFSTFQKPFKSHSPAPHTINRKAHKSFNAVCIPVYTTLPRAGLLPLLYPNTPTMPYVAL